MAAAEAGEAPLCEYEQQRAARIKRNREIMASLGLFDEDVALAAAMRKAHEEGGGAGGKGGTKKGGKRKLAADAEAPSEPARRSARVAGLPSDGKSVKIEERGLWRDKETVTLDDVHAQEASHYDMRHAQQQRRASVVGTASYQHTLFRVRTMTPVGLANRIKVIERAKGQHAVIKMRLFARVLFLEGYEDLADEATKALLRLIALLGDVVSDEE